MAGISRKPFRILRFAEPNPPFPASDNCGSPVRTNSPGWKSMPQESGPGSQEEAMKDVKKRLQEQILSLQKSLKEDPRWKDIRRPYQAEEVVRLRGSLRVHHTLAEIGARRFWDLLHSEPYVPALGALTGNQAVQQVQAGLKAIYVSGWQVAGDANSAGHMYPDQSLYPVDSVPKVVSRINNALIRADQIQHMNGGDETNWFAPIVADAEAGFGGPLNTYELIKAMIEAGADAMGAQLIRGDFENIDKAYLTGERTAEGYFRVRGGLEFAIARALEYAPFADIVWCETSTPDLGEAREFAQAIRERHPGKMLAYNCSPSFNWKRNLDDATIADFQNRLGEMGYKFQFVTLAGFHSLNASMYELA